MPALKIDDPESAIRVATEVVSLTEQKQAEGKGWGYAYLKQWLPDRFGIPCGKQAKQAAVFRALLDLEIVEVEKKGRKGRATHWRLGARSREHLGLPNPGACKSDEKEYLRWTFQGCPTDDLEGEGGEEEKGSTYLCSL